MAPGHAARANQVSSRSDTLSSPNISATSNHTIVFTVRDNIVSQGGLTASSNFSIAFPFGFNLSTLTCNDVDLLVAGSATSLNVANGDGRTNCPNTATAWGVNVDSANRILLLTSPTSVNQWTWIATGTAVTVRIGSNATFQGQGADWITNPSTGGVYTIAVGGTFNGSGNMLVQVGRSSIQFVQGNAGQCNASCTATTIPFVSNNTAGNLIVVSFDYPDSVSLLSVTDTQGNVYTRAGSEVHHPNNNFDDIYYAKNIKGGANAVTVELNGSGSFIEVYVHEYSGLDPTSPLDVTAASTGNGTNLDSGPATTNFAQELIFGVGYTGAVNSPGSGFTSRLTLNSNMTEDKIVSVIGTYDATENGGGGNWAMLEATFKQAIFSSAVQVSATIAESLSFTASSVSSINCIADDGATISAVTSTVTSVPFGTISINTFYQGCQDLVVSTNAGNGYSVTVQESSAFKTIDGRFIIPDTTCDAGDCSVATATTWVTPTKNGFGHTCFNQIGSDCNPTYGNGKKFKPVSNIAVGNNGATINFVQSGSTLRIRAL